jgi:hypothetical protein
MLRASVICISLVLASHAPAQTLRIGLQADPATLDPAQSVSFVDRVVMAAVCDKLIELDAKLAYVPQLATEWAWAADGLSLTMKLRAGVLFHDGEPLDAEAVMTWIASPMFNVMLRFNKFGRYALSDDQRKGANLVAGVRLFGGIRRRVLAGSTLPTLPRQPFQEAGSQALAAAR